MIRSTSCSVIPGRLSRYSREARLMLTAPHALLHALDYGLGIATHGFGRFSRALPDFVGIVFGGAASDGGAAGDAHER